MIHIEFRATGAWGVWRRCATLLFNQNRYYSLFQPKTIFIFAPIFWSHFLNGHLFRCWHIFDQIFNQCVRFVAYDYATIKRNRIRSPISNLIRNVNNREALFFFSSQCTSHKCPVSMSISISVRIFFFAPQE